VPDLRSRQRPERCNQCGGELVPKTVDALVPLLVCRACGREVPAAAVASQPAPQEVPGADGLRAAERRLLNRARLAPGAALLGPDSLDTLVEVIESLGRLRVRQLERMLTSLEVAHAD
jgi:hypothetical protein